MVIALRASRGYPIIDRGSSVQKNESIQVQGGRHNVIAVCLRDIFSRIVLMMIIHKATHSVSVKTGCYYAFPINR
jgi:hypothetical protein